MATKRELAKGLGIDADRLEGYLFPDTYYFPKGTKLEDIAKRMVQRYREVFVDSYRARAAELGFTEHQIVTLASIIEKEAKVPTERSLVAAVYHNRLRIGMKVQADPTAVYGTKAWITSVTKQDLQRRSPYNTYLRKGLPRGPIANPGQGAILAALYPEDVDYLFRARRGAAEQDDVLSLHQGSFRQPFSVSGAPAGAPRGPRRAALPAARVRLRGPGVGHARARAARLSRRARGRRPDPPRGRRGRAARAGRAGDDRAGASGGVATSTTPTHRTFPPPSTWSSWG